MDANKALELATIAFPNNTEMRSVYMLGLDKGYELCKEQMMKEFERWIKGNLHHLSCWNEDEFCLNLRTHFSFKED